MIGSVGGTALGAYPLGLSLDLTGSYSPALTALLLPLIAICFAMIFVKRPRKQGTEVDHVDRVVPVG